MRLLNTLAIGLLCLVAAGCGQASGQPEPQRFPVHGAVTLDGKPLASGLIYFKTIQTGAVDSAEIKDGKFEGKAQAGDRRVEICSYETVQPAADDPMGTVIQRNTLPPRYHLESSLTAKVTQEGPNEFNFELSSR
jgi:hypothetical protein